MSARLEVTAFSESLAERLARDPLAASGEVALFWLGQAGFVLEAAGRRLLIDPYLSDSLAAKYAGSATPHDRMMPAPIAPEAIARADAVLLTHRHTDHMDPDTLRPLAQRLERLRFVAPAAEEAEALRRAGIEPARLLGVDAGERHDILPGVAIRVVRAAHEGLERDADGSHRFLGYGIEAEGIGVFHSGDTIPFPGQVEEVAALGRTSRSCRSTAAARRSPPPASPATSRRRRRPISAAPPASPRCSPTITACSPSTRPNRRRSTPSRRSPGRSGWNARERGWSIAFAPRPGSVDAGWNAQPFSAPKRHGVDTA